MYLVLFLFIASFLLTGLGEFGQFPFGQTTFSVSIVDILLFTTLFFLLSWNIGIKKNLAVPKHYFWLLGFLFIAFFSLVVNLNLTGWFYWFRFLIYANSFYIAYHLAKSKIVSPVELFNLIKLTAIFLAILGLVQYFFIPNLQPLTFYGYDPHVNRLVSTFLDPNYTGSFLAIGMLIVCSQFLSRKYPNFQSFINSNKLSLLYFIVILISIILTFSRSSYLMITSSLFTLLLLKKKLLLIPLFFVPIILYLIYPPFAVRINGGLLIDDSANERFYSWNKGIEIFKQKPIFGVGFNNIRETSDKLNLNKTFSADGGNSGAGIDSSLIFVLATTGIVGFLSVFLFISKIVKDFFSSNIKNNLSSLLIALIIGLFLNSLFINSLFFPPITLIFFSLLGLYYGVGDAWGD